ncbi:MAG: Rrf2 family transcriptional regulator [bacterium]|nr:Rrf2 family transcriptional regulator [bacterium]
MILSRQADYGIRVMIDVARFGGSEPVTTRDIAERQQIPTAFLHKTVTQLSKAQLLSARRGAGGGLTLQRSADLISVLHIVEAIEGPLSLMDCTMNGNPCERSDHCAVHDLLEETTHELSARLNATSLAELLTKQIAADAKAKRRRKSIVQINAR